MARPSPITIAVLTLTASVVAVGIYLVARPRHDPEPAPAAAEDEPPPPPPDDKPPPAPAETAARAALAAVVQAAAAEKAASDENNQAVKNRRLVLSSQRHKLRRSADESVFEVLNIPEATRAAIRRLNDESERRDEESIRNLAAGTPMDPTTRADGHDGNNDTARQSAIEALLGPDVTPRFTSFESANVRRLKRRTRGERDRELNASGPMPQRRGASAAGGE